MRVLVTGNLGYVGTILTPILAKDGHEVVGLDRGYFRECVLGALPASGVTRQINKDIRDIERADVVGFDAIVHLAALSNDPIGNLNPALTEAINLRASERLAELANAEGVQRFVFASSCSIYGQSTGAALDEESTLSPLTAYAYSKVQFEQSLTALASDKFSTLSLRNATAYGFSSRLRIDLVVNNLVASAMTSGEVKLLSDGTAWRPLLHVEDMSRAFATALSTDRRQWHGLALNVGAAEDNYQVRDLATIVASVVPDSAVTIAEGAGADNRNYNVNFSRIREVLPAWKPTFNVPTGTQEVFNGMRHADFLRKDFRGHRYSRLQHLLHLQSEGRIDDELRLRGTDAL